MIFNADLGKEAFHGCTGRDSGNSLCDAICPSSFAKKVWKREITRGIAKHFSLDDAANGDSAYRNVAALFPGLTNSR